MKKEYSVELESMRKVDGTYDVDGNTEELAAFENLDSALDLFYAFDLEGTMRTEVETAAPTAKRGKGYMLKVVEADVDEDGEKEFVEVVIARTFTYDDLDA